MRYLLNKQVATALIAMELLVSCVTTGNVKSANLSNVEALPKQEITELLSTVNPDTIIERPLQIQPVSRGGGELSPPSFAVFEVTAYDLSVASCGKRPGDKGFGLAKSGYDLREKDIRDKLISVDPSVVPLWSTVRIEFPEEIRYVKWRDGKTIDLNGTYTAVDTGGAIKGRKIDLFVGGYDKFSNKLALEIGRRKVKVYKSEG